jgi:hypothetical protein
MSECPKCHFRNEGGKFCERCGTALGNYSMVNETAAAITVESHPTQTNKYVEGAKSVSKTYVNYFKETLKNPYASSMSVTRDHFNHALITIALYAILIPLSLYFGLKSLIGGLGEITGGLFGPEEISLPVGDFVVKPILSYAVFIALVVSFTILALKVRKVKFDLQEVVARFGTILIPIVTLLVIGLLLSIIGLKYFMFFVLLGFITSVFMIPAIVITSYKGEETNSFDSIYGVLLTYTLTFITIYIMNDILFSSIKGYFANIFNSSLF